MDLSAIQKALQQASLDGWLFYDFHNRDAMAARILNMDTHRFASRRWYFYIPASGTPQKLVHSIEPWRCDHLPGDKHIYLAWQQQHQLLHDILAGAKKVAMQYSPFNAIPYVSIVDAGTVELIRSFGVTVVSSADLVGQFEAHLSQQDWHSHQQAGVVMQMVKDEAFREINRRIRAGQHPPEYDIYLFMKNLMDQHGVVAQDGPIVAVNEHAADPHFEPTAQNSFHMKEGDLVLLDLWARKNQPHSIYYDITWMGYIGEEIPEKIQQLFGIVRDARQTAFNFIKKRFQSGKDVFGWEVDDACRAVIVKAGYGEFFIHRTGHNIGEEVHGNGVNIDNLETKDERRIQPGTCFSIEPGIYLPQQKLGFRSEIDVFVTDEGTVEVSGAQQDSVVAITRLS